MVLISFVMKYKDACQDSVNQLVQYDVARIYYRALAVLSYTKWYI